MNDYRFYIVSITGYFYPHESMRIWVKVYKTKKAIANKVHYPGTGRVERYVSAFNAALSNHEEMVLFWNGQELINKAEYDFKLANLQKRWLKMRAERDKKATVKDVERFLRNNSVNSNGKPDIKAGQNTSKSTESIDRCQGVK